jgi:hypothetical protein
MEWNHAALFLYSWSKRRRRWRSRRKKKKVVVMLMMMIEGEIRLAPLASCYEHEPSDSIKHEECSTKQVAISS